MVEQAGVQCRCLLGREMVAIHAAMLPGGVAQFQGRPFLRARR
jgi:hypothetical protein